MNKRAITVKIERFNPKVDASPRYQEYEVEAEEDMSVLRLVKYIHENLDRTLAYRNAGCYVGVCTACLMNINGKNLRACSTIVSAGDKVTIEPLKRNYPVIRDLVVDFGLLREKAGFLPLDESIET